MFDECCEVVMCLLVLWIIVIFGCFLGGKIGVCGNMVVGDFFVEGGSLCRIDFVGGVMILGVLVFFVEGGSLCRIDWVVVIVLSFFLIFVLGLLVNEFGVCEILGLCNVLVIGIVYVLVFKEGVV